MSELIKEFTKPNGDIHQYYSDGTRLLFKRGGNSIDVVTGLAEPHYSEAVDISKEPKEIGIEEIVSEVFSRII